MCILNVECANFYSLLILVDYPSQTGLFYDCRRPSSQTIDTRTGIPYYTRTGTPMHGVLRVDPKYHQ